MFNSMSFFLVMWTKMVGDLMRFYSYYGHVNPKWKQAVVETKLSAIRLMLIRKKGWTFICLTLNFFGKPMAKKTYL